MQVYVDNDLYGGQRSVEAKCGKICAIITKLVQQSAVLLQEKMVMVMTFVKAIVRWGAIGPEIP